MPKEIKTSLNRRFTIHPRKDGDIAFDVHDDTRDQLNFVCSDITPIEAETIIFTLQEAIVDAKKNKNKEFADLCNRVANLEQRFEDLKQTLR